MTVNQRVYLRVDGELKTGKVEVIKFEDLKIRLDSGELVERKFWEIAKVKSDLSQT